MVRVGLAGLKCGTVACDAYDAPLRADDGHVYEATCCGDIIPLIAGSTVTWSRPWVCSRDAKVKRPEGEGARLELIASFPSQPWEPREQPTQRDKPPPS